LSPIPCGVEADLSAMQTYAAMLFDVYGTLLVSAAGEIGPHHKTDTNRHTLQALLQHYAIEQSPPVLIEKLHDHIKAGHQKDRQQGIVYPEVDIVRIWQEVLAAGEQASWIADFALEFELIVNPVYPMPGFKELLAACRASTLATGIISNAQQYTLDVLTWFLGGDLDAWGFDPELLFFSWCCGQAKPATLMFNQAKAVLARMGIPAHAVLYVGNDMRNDVLPAQSVGFKTGLFAGDRRSWRRREDDAHCRGRRPDLVVTDLRQLLAGIEPP
jgi:putative hydrolase of the HAD superfamily